MRCNGTNKYDQIQVCNIIPVNTKKCNTDQKRGTLQHRGDVPLFYILIITLWAAIVITYSTASQHKGISYSI